MFLLQESLQELPLPRIDAFGPGTHAVIYGPLDLAPVTPRAVGLVGMPQPPTAQLFVRMSP